MKNLLLFIFLFISFSVVHAQNLIPDPSFELSSIYMNTWKRTYGTVDLFDIAIDSLDAGVKPPRLIPITHIVNLKPHSGNRVIGSIFTHFDEKRMSESTHIRLSSTLQAGAVYKVEMYAMLSKRDNHPMEYIPILFTQEEPDGAVGNVRFTALKSRNKFVSQRSNWEKVTGYYKAKGGEQYLLIGNFKNANYKQLYENSKGSWHTYYFFDDVSVTLSEEAKPEITTVQDLKPVSKFYTQTPIQLTFKTAKTDVTEAYRDTMNECLEFLRNNPNVVLIIEGHTDNVGSSKYNQHLSEVRAQMTAQFFLENGIAENRLKVKGFGRTKPIASNDTEKGRSQNRRVTIHFEINDFNEIQYKALHDFAKLYGYIRYFHPSMEAQQINWNEFTAFGVHQLRNCKTADECRKTLKEIFFPITTSVNICEGSTCITIPFAYVNPKTPIKFWEYDGLGGGNPTYAHQLVTSRSKERFFEDFPAQRSIKDSLQIGGSYNIPIILPNVDIEYLSTDFKNLLQKIDDTQLFREDMYIGNTIIVWNLMQHFYPYFDELPHLDWTATLPDWLKQSSKIHTDDDFYKFLQVCSVLIKDGHSRVGWDKKPGGMWLPFDVEIASNQFVVTRVGVEGIELGDIILKVDGRPALEMYQADTASISGSDSWKKGQGLTSFGVDKQYTKAQIQLKRGNTIKNVEVIRDWADFDYFFVKELENNIYYVQLTDVGNIDTVLHYLPQLTTAKGIIWDIRGYLYNDFTKLLAHFITEPDTIKWLASPGMMLPDQKNVIFDWQSLDIEPKSPTLQVPMVFLTNGKAISASETFMMFINHYNIGKIIGEPTAGANGSRNWQSLYGGFRFHWTGMKVKHFDGRPFHNQGVQPDILVYPKYEDLIKGKDTVLEKAIEILSK